MLSSFKFPHGGTRFFVIVLLLLCIFSIDLKPGECRRKKKKVPDSYPHVLASKSWAPAISPDFISSVKREKLIVANRFGRLSIVDFKKAGIKGNVASVISEITGVGRTIVSLSSNQKSTYALLKDKTDRQKPAKTKLIEISTKKLKEPSVVSIEDIESIKDPGLVLADRKFVFVSGKSKTNQDIILVINAKRRKGETGVKILSTVTTQMPVVSLDFDGRRLAALCSSKNGSKSLLNFINLSSATTPDLEKKIELEGDYNLLNRYKNVLIVAGKDKNNKPETRSIYLKPAPNVVAGVTLDQLESITSVLVLKNQVLVAGNSAKGGKLISLNMDKHANLLTASEIELSTKNKRGRRSGKLAYDGKQLYVSAGWAGIETLKKRKGSWEKQFLYTIPRMGASGMASWGNSAVLVSGELVKYDLSNPEEPKIEAKASLKTPVKSMVGAGSYILCLTRNKLLLRKMEDIDKDVAEIEINGNSVAFDKGEHKAYVVKGFGKLTRINPVKVYSNSLDAQSSFDVPGNFSKIKASNGKLLVFDLNDISLFKVGENVNKVGSRHLEKFAIRDAWLVGDKVIATAIDHNSSGFLLIMNALDDGLNILSNTPLPHNGTSLSAGQDKVITVGKSKKDGRDLVSLIDISNPISPKEVNSVPVIESASTVTMNDKVALVAGRGLEILLVE